MRLVSQRIVELTLTPSPFPRTAPAPFAPKRIRGLHQPMLKRGASTALGKGPGYLTREVRVKFRESKWGSVGAVVGTSAVWNGRAR
jgi:hypothetical protein